VSTLFETERLLVRRATTADVVALLPIFGDAETVRHFGHGRPWTQVEIGQYLASYPEGDERLVSTPGVVLLKPHLEVVGFGGVGYYVSEGNTADLLFILQKEWWGKGLATEFASAALVTALRHPQVASVYATAKPANVASVRVLEKCGMWLVEYLPEKDRLLFRIDRPVGQNV
jgi:RimJ/RimL family protein N-acetyltransferase